MCEQLYLLFICLCSIEISCITSCLEIVLNFMSNTNVLGYVIQFLMYSVYRPTGILCVCACVCVCKVLCVYRMAGNFCFRKYKSKGLIFGSENQSLERFIFKNLNLENFALYGMCECMCVCVCVYV